MRTCRLWIIFLAFGLPSLMNAQNHWQAEFRPEISFPVNENELNTGYGFELGIGYIFLPHLSAYAGWSWNSFKGDSFLELPDVEITENGYKFGLRFMHPVKGTRWSYLISAGTILMHLKLEDKHNNKLGDNSHKLGWEAGGGFHLELPDNFGLRPVLSYRSYSPEISVQALSEKREMNFLSFSLGISKTF